MGVDTFCYGVYHELDQFRDAYHAKYHKEPYVNPVTRWRWYVCPYYCVLNLHAFRDIAQTVTRRQHDDAVDRMAIYKQWFLDKILQVGQRNTLLVLPITNQAVDYRDVPPE